MRQIPPNFDQLLEFSSPRLIAEALRSSDLPISLPQAQQLVSHMEGMGEPRIPLRIAIVHTYTSDLLNPWLKLEALLESFDLSVYHAPYGLSMQEARAGSDLAEHDPDMTVFLLRREDLHPDLATPLAGFAPDERAEIQRQAVDRLCSIVRTFRQHIGGQIVVTILPSIVGPGPGIYDSQSERSDSGWWAGLKSLVSTIFREELQSTLFLDLDELLSSVGRKQFFDKRFWYSARFPFSPTASREFSRQLASIAAVQKLPKAKVIVLDADNTLWGGVIGEDGMNGIQLGPDYPGNTFVEFQRRLLDFQQRGFLLAICSKNNPADLEQVLREHPHQVLRDEHFAARRVNWEPKPDNLISLANELNLGLESFVFVDDSDHECASVRHRLPQVEVVQTPKKPVEVPFCLDRIARLETLLVTPEDHEKTLMYAQQRERRTLMETVADGDGDYTDYLASLQMHMTVAMEDASQLKRLSQLTQKTNQFNLTTRRYSEQDIERFILSPDYSVIHFSLSDVFGDSGVVGLAIVDFSGAEKPLLDTFLMSCRVIGRRAEDAFFDAVLAQVEGRGYDMLAAEHIPTPKNVLVNTLLPEQGFVEGAEGVFVKDLRNFQPRSKADIPIVVDVV